MSQYLVLSAVGNDKPGIVKELSKMIVQHQGNINSSRMMTMGGEFAVMLMVEADDNAIEQIQAALPAIESELGLTIVARKTRLSPQQTARVPYAVEVISIDHPGIIQQIADFFSSRQANIEEMNTDTYAAAHTGTQMFSLNMIVDLPAEAKIAPLREQFMEFCDDLNLDASLEID